jgi:hypothetical protein
MAKSTFSTPDTLQPVASMGNALPNLSGGGIGIEDVLSTLGGVFGGLGTGGWGAIAGGLVTGLSALGKDPKQEKFEKIFDKLEDSEEYLKSTPFTKDEIMGQLLPQAQKIYRGAADILGGKAGAAVGESGVAKGQSFGEYYTQALAPIIAQGEQQAGDAISRFGQWYSGLDAQAKNRFLDAVRLQMGAAAGTDDMTDLQKFITGGIPGASFGANIGGEIDIIKELSKRLQLGEEQVGATANYGNVNAQITG